MFSLRMRESVSNVVEIDDMRPQVLDAFLEYIYVDASPRPHLAPELLAVADKYQMPGLLHTCECVLARSLTLVNCLGALLFADRYALCCPHLRDTVLGFIVRHFHVVSKSEGFVRLMKQRTELAHEIVCESANVVAFVDGPRMSG